MLDDRLYQRWLPQLQTWAADGRLVSAGVDALRLKPGQATDQLKRIANRLAEGDTRDVPPIELWASSAMPGAAGAFAQATGSIYVNQDWVQTSDEQGILRLLTEEYGHYLDNQLNKTDTAGDKGAVFAEQLLGAGKNGLASHKNSHLLEEDDHGHINVNGQLVETEFLVVGVGIGIGVGVGTPSIPDVGPAPIIILNVQIDDGGDGFLNAAEQSSASISGSITGASDSEALDGEVVDITISDGDGSSINTTATVNSNSYSRTGLDLSSLNEGTLTISANASFGETFFTDSTTKDTSLPTIAVSSDVSSLKAGETTALTFTLSESSTDFTVDDVSVSGGSLSNFSGSGSSYSATFTPDTNSDTNEVISIASGVFSDAAGNTNVDGSDSNNSVTLSVDTVSAPPFTRLGNDIDGEASGDSSGISVSLSNDGSVVAIGATGNDDNGISSGHTRVYAWDGSAWVQRGSDIDGEAAADTFGTAISLSSDGTTIAVGAPNNDGSNGSNSGHTRVFDWDGSSWVQRGSDIDGEAASDSSGISISLASDGNTLAVGAPGNSSGKGHTRIYEWNGSSWVQRGSDIDGEAAIDFSGISVSLSSDATSVAIGAFGNDDNGDNSGHTRIYQWDAGSSSWNQLGGDINGEAASEESGNSVSLSSDGSIVAIGAYRNGENGNWSGKTRIYAWDGSAWVQRGSDLVGEGEGDLLGSTVSLSSDGSVVAIGAPNNDGNGSNSGHTRIYQWDGSAWNQLGSDIDGEAASDQSGTAVSLSSDGSVLAIGALYNDDNGSSSGHVRVFKLPDITPPTIAVTSDVSSLSDGETATLTFTLSESSTDFTVDDISVSGGTLSNFSGSGSSYSATFTPNTDSTSDGVISVASGVFSDSAGNNNLDGDDANNSLTLSINTVRTIIALTSDVASLSADENPIPSSTPAFTPEPLPTPNPQSSPEPALLPEPIELNCLINNSKTNSGLRITGSPCSDIIKSQTKDDVLLGRHGDDHLKGKPGKDLLRGGQGDDDLRGGQGDDTLRGGQGADNLIGNKGHDRLIGQQGNDVIRGRSGDDTIQGGQGDDTIKGGRGADLIHLSHGQDQILDFKPRQGDRLVAKNHYSFEATELDGSLILSDIENNTEVTLSNIDFNTMLAVQPELFS